MIGIANAATLGTGELTIGSSLDNEESYQGFTAGYNIESETAIQRWQASGSFEYSSAKNRPSALNGHQYLYDKNAASGSVDHLLKTPSPYFSVISGAEYKQTGEVDVSGDRLYDWSGYTGPSFSKYIRQDIKLLLNANFGRQFINDYHSENQYWDIRLNKNFNRMSNLELVYSEDCWDYKDDQVTDNCQVLVEGVYSVKTASTVVNISYGESRIDNTNEEIYGMDVNYKLSQTDSLILSSQRETSNLKNILEIKDNIDLNLPNTKIIRNAVTYNRKFQRFSAVLELNETEYETEALTILEKEKYAFGSYLLGSNQCPICSVEIEFLENEKVVDSWKTWSVGLRYPLKRHWNTFISMQKTTQNSGDELTSLNFQLNYDGSPRLLGR